MKLCEGFWILIQDQGWQGGYTVGTILAEGGAERLSLNAYSHACYSGAYYHFHLSTLMSTAGPSVSTL